MDENSTKRTSEQEEEKATGGTVNSPSAELHISQCSGLRGLFFL